jgi:hypothetical protein
LRSSKRARAAGIRVGGEERSSLLSFVLRFTSLFINWDENDQVIKLNIRDALDF